MGVNGIYGLSGSGLDIESMVKVGMMSKQNEYDKMQQKYTQNEWKKSSYLDLYGQVNTFNMSTLSQYKMSSNMNAHSATSSNESAVSVNANADALQMTHYVKVNNLAYNAYLISDYGDEHGVKTHNVGSKDSINLADALFKDVSSRIITEINDKGEEVTRTMIKADDAEFKPDAIAFQFALEDGKSGQVVSSNEEIVAATANTSAANGAHSVEVKGGASIISEKLHRANTSDSKSLDLKNLIFNSLELNEDGRYGYQINGTATNSNEVLVDYNLDGTETALSFTVGDGENSAEISFTYEDIYSGKTINDLVDKINKYTSETNIFATYDSVKDTFSLTNKGLGVDTKLKIEVPGENDVTAAFLGWMKFTGENNDRFNSTAEIDSDGNLTFETSGVETYGKIDGKEAKFKDNVATVNGVTYTATGTGNATVRVNQKVVSVTYQQLLDGYTFNDLASDINSFGTNVTANYDTVQDSFIFYNKESGGDNLVNFKMADNIKDDAIGDRTANFFTNLHLKQMLNGEPIDEYEAATDETPAKGFNPVFNAGESNEIAGSNAKVTIDGMVYQNLDSNHAVINGVIYDFNKVTGDETVTVNVTQDVEKIVDKVKSFVEDYNKLLSSLYELYNEKPNSDYKPLTQSQKDDMKDEQIEKWEAKAKEGLLYHDATLGKIISNMRDAVMQKVEGVDSNYNNIFALGISTTGTQGQLTLNEDKLRTALANDPEAVYNVFAKLDKDDDFSSNGIAQRLGDVFNTGLKAIKTRAGSDTGISEDSDLNNLLRELQLKMSNFQKMMNAFEDKLYKKYDAMETSLAMLGAQLNYVSTAFGG